MGEEDCCLVRDMKTFSSHEIGIFEETVVFPTAITHPVFSSLCLQNWTLTARERSRLAVPKQKCSASYWNPPSLPTFLLEKRKRTSSSWLPSQQGEAVTAKFSVLRFPLLGPACVHSAADIRQGLWCSCNVRYCWFTVQPQETKGKLRVVALVDSRCDKQLGVCEWQTGMLFLAMEGFTCFAQVQFGQVILTAQCIPLTPSVTISKVLPL